MLPILFEYPKGIDLKLRKVNTNNYASTFTIFFFTKAPT